MIGGSFMYKKFIDSVLKVKLNPSYRYIVSVSGGVDSMVLLDVLRQTNVPLTVVFFDHQTRMQTKEELKMVKDYCLFYHLDFKSYTLNISPKKNFQSEARKLRYQHLKSLYETLKPAYIFTGHHLNDLAESYHMQDLEGSERFKMNFIHDYQDMTFVKPFLYINKDKIYDYAQTYKIPYLEDASNDETHYFRNKVRKLVKSMAHEDPNFYQKIIDKHLQEQHLKEQIHLSSNASLNTFNEVSIEKFFRSDLLVQIEILRQQLLHANIKPKKVFIQSILSILKNPKPHLQVQLSSDTIYQKSYDKGFIRPLTLKKPFNQILHEGKQRLESACSFTFFHDITHNTTSHLKLCYNELVFPLVARHRKQGDYLHFSYGRKKLKSFLIEKKVPAFERDNLILICDSRDTILLIPNLYINQTLGNNHTLYYQFNKEIVTMDQDILEILVSEKEIDDLCQSLAKTITNDYQNKDLLLVGLLKGCLPFMMNLSKYIKLPLTMSFMSVSSYHGGIKSSGDVKIHYDLDVSIKDRHVLIVEDIVDTANTIITIQELFKHRGAASVEIVTLLDKPSGRLHDYIPKYIGKTIPKAFVVGFGLDYEEKYRNLPYVGILKPQVYEKGNIE